MRDEGSKTVAFNLLFAVDAELFLDLKLYGQTMGVPTRLTQNAFAAHGLVTGNQVFDNTRKYMTDVGLTVRGRRTIVEAEGAGFAALLHTSLKNMLALPEGARRLFSLNKVQTLLDFFVDFAHSKSPFILINHIQKQKNPVRKRTGKAQRMSHITT